MLSSKREAKNAILCIVFPEIKTNREQKCSDNANSKYQHAEAPLKEKKKSKHNKTHQDPSHQQVSHVSVWTMRSVRNSTLLADTDARSL